MSAQNKEVYTELEIRKCSYSGLLLKELYEKKKVQELTTKTMRIISRIMVSEGFVVNVMDR